MKLFIACLSFLFCCNVYSQDSVKAFVRLVQPFKETNTVKSSRQFIVGSTCKTCLLTINADTVKTYSTGAFAYELNLVAGDSSFTITAFKTDSTFAVKTLHYNYTLPKAPDTVKVLDITSIQTFPEGNLILQAGDRIKFRIKALTGCKATLWDNVPLYEMPLNQSKGIPGIYQGEYVIKETDTFSLITIPIKLTGSDEKSITKETKNIFSVLSPASPDIAVTKGRLAHLEYGLGEDRLGGAKIGYIDSQVVLKIIGKVGSHYKVRLSKTRTAYIPDELIELMPKGTFTPASLTDKWNVYGDEKYDYVRVGLFTRLPYQSFQLLDPARIVVDIYGATNNTNWITQFQNVKEIKNVHYEQVEDDVFRVTIELKHPQHWGHQVYYSGNNLMIKIKHQPENLSLKNMTIAIFN
ncbi:MAG: AMIN domain-containing protein [Sphingobacteriales bacterium]|nr:AMIN domain-containing protein [Sphingobacteriales bacterium]